jgi:IS4 transposase
VDYEKNAADKKPFAFYASSDTTISGTKIWEYSRARWAIEKLFRDLKQNLSFGTLATRKKGKSDGVVVLRLSPLTSARFVLSQKSKKALTSVIKMGIQFVQKTQSGPVTSQGPSKSMS